MDTTALLRFNDGWRQELFRQIPGSGYYFMTEISQYLEKAEGTPPDDIDWSSPPWVAAQPLLAWLGIAPQVAPLTPTTALLSDSDARLICDRMMLRFADKSDRLVWSSYMLSTAVKGVARAVGGQPEPLLKSAWDFLAERKLDKDVYEFCRALGSAVRAQHGASTSWDLEWTQSPATPSQACLRYWILAVKPELWDGEVETTTMSILRTYPFQF